jgi:hypothetical protein
MNIHGFRSPATRELYNSILSAVGIARLAGRPPFDSQTAELYRKPMKLDTRSTRLRGL